MALNRLEAGQQQLLTQLMERLNLAAGGEGLKAQMHPPAVDSTKVNALG